MNWIIVVVTVSFLSIGQINIAFATDAKICPAVKTYEELKACCAKITDGFAQIDCLTTGPRVYPDLFRGVTGPFIGKPAPPAAAYHKLIPLFPPAGLAGEPHYRRRLAL